MITYFCFVTQKMDDITINIPCLGMDTDYTLISEEEKHKLLPIRFVYSSQPDDVKTILRHIVEDIDMMCDFDITVDELISVTLVDCTANDSDPDYKFEFTFNPSTDDSSIMELEFLQVEETHRYKTFCIYCNNSFLRCLHMRK